MEIRDIPFNIDLLKLTPEKLKGIKPVTSLERFDGNNTGNYHEDGLFSISIFGRTGDDQRMLRMSYIDIKIPIFHPLIYKALISLKGLYAGIMNGTEYAKWNADILDFERSNTFEGETGFAFFEKYWKDIVFEPSKSVQRQQYIALIDKYKDRALVDKIVVMPAGYRDIEISNGRIREDEINTFYRKFLAVANTISPAAIRHNPEVLNTARGQLQTNFCNLFEFIQRMIDGKKKLIMNKWASRRVFNTTRNVITAMDSSTPYLWAPGSISFNNSVLGLYQMLKSVLPISIYLLKTGFLSKVFSGSNLPVKLVDKKTLKSVSVNLKPAYHDRWFTDEGLEHVITAFQDDGIKHKPVEINGHYLGLIYKGPDKTFKIIQSIDELPSHLNKDFVTPLTFAELMYCSTYRALNRYPLFITRYPVAGMGSIYPSKAFVKTTLTAETRSELSDTWSPMDESHTAYQFPVIGSAFVNSLSPHSAKLQGLTADFDGDVCSANSVYSEESIKEVDDYLKTRQAYVGTDGKFLSSTGVVTVELTLRNLTGDYQEP